MRKTYKQLRTEFDKKVKKLQASCPHKKVSKEMTVCWSPGHSTDTKVKICLTCNKEVMRRYLAHLCLKCGDSSSIYIIDDKCLVKGCGGERRAFEIIEKCGKNCQITQKIPQ